MKLEDVVTVDIECEIFNMGYITTKASEKIYFSVITKEEFDKRIESERTGTEGAKPW